MARRRKNKNKNNILRIDDPVLRQAAADIVMNNDIEKVQTAPQTYIEDTFEIGNESPDEPLIITNEVKKKEKIIKDQEELTESFAFKNKVNKIKVRVEHERSFLFLFDYTESTKLYKTYYINEIDDEYDLLLLQTVMIFKKKLATMQISYELYKKYELYFDAIKFLYGKFKRADNTEKNALNLELQNMKDLSVEISYHFFK